MLRVPSRPPIEAVLNLYPEAMFLEGNHGTLRVAVTRADFPTRCKLLVGNLGVILSVDGPKRIGFPLRPEVAASLRSWLTPVLRQICGQTLRRRALAAAALGLLNVVTSLPIGDHPVSWSGLALGAAFLVFAGGVTVTSHPSFFLLDAATWAAVAVWNVVRVVDGRSKLWLLLAALCASFVASALKCFRFFRAAPHERV
jgi:hypothetical protein